MVDTFGGHVPNYDIFGHQDARQPFKDKSSLATGKVKPEWTATPRFRSRSEMQSARRAEKLPDKSFDFDGNGAVSHKEFFIGKTFDRDGDGRLNTGEKAAAIQAIQDGFFDSYSFDHERAGVTDSHRRGQIHRVQQRRGRIITENNAHEQYPSTYPPHPISSNVPKYPTMHDMKIGRKAHLKNSGLAIKEEFDRHHPYLVPEPPVMQEDMLETPAHTHISQRREEYRQEAREMGGLPAENTYVNPMRESMNPTLAFVHDPAFSTMTSLTETRRLQMQHDLEEQRLRGENDFIPYAIRKAQREAQSFEYRRPGDDAQTLTKLKDRRKQDRIEYDQARFTNDHFREQSHARYSSQSQPWWTLQGGYEEHPPSCTLKELERPKEVVGKVTETCHARPVSEISRELSEVGMHDAPCAQVASVDGITGKTLKKWSEEWGGGGARWHSTERVFDEIISNAAHVYSHDSDNVDFESSFRVVRENARKEERDCWDRANKFDQTRYAARRAERERTLQGQEELSQQASMEADRRLQHNASALSINSRTSSRAADHSNTSHMKVPMLQLLQPVGEDIPMMERLTQRPRRRSADDEGDSKPPTPKMGRPATLRQRTGSLKRSGTSHEQIEGSKAMASAATAPLGDNMGGSVVVRTGGFQWVDTQLPNTKGARRGASTAADASTSLQITPRASQRHQSRQSSEPCPPPP